MLHRRIEKTATFGEFHNLIELTVDLLPAHSQNRAVEINIFPPRQFRMKAGSDLEEAAGAPMDYGLTLRRLGNSGQDLQ